jgi:hypothetical protein
MRKKDIKERRGKPKKDERGGRMIGYPLTVDGRDEE